MIFNFYYTHYIHAKNFKLKTFRVWRKKIWGVYRRFSKLWLFSRKIVSLWYILIITAFLLVVGLNPLLYYRFGWDERVSRYFITHLHCVYVVKINWQVTFWIRTKRIIFGFKLYFCRTEWIKNSKKISGSEISEDKWSK